MIKANELRLGNWVRYIGNTFTVAHHHIDNGQIIDIDSLDDGCINNNHPYYDIQFKDIEPITLTPEILESAGFTFSDGVYYSPDLEIFLGGPEGHYYYRNYRPTKSVYHKINYVHQLQNLYFALTNKELEINLTTLCPSLP